MLNYWNAVKWNVEMLIYLNPKMLKFWNAECWNAENWKKEHWNAEMLKFCNADILKHWNTEMLKIVNAKVLKCR